MKLKRKILLKIREVVNNLLLEMFVKVNYEIFLVSPYEFIKCFIFDLKYSNYSEIKRLDLLTHINDLENLSIYMTKLMFHSHFFGAFS